MSKIDDLYSQAKADKSGGTWEHLELLSRLSSLCGHVTEFGVERGASTAALLFGRPKILISYDIRDCDCIPKLVEAANEIGVEFQFHKANVLDVKIEWTDFLFIDTEHTYDQLRKELLLHARRVNKYMAFHDVALFGDSGMLIGGMQTQGIWPAIAEFMRLNSDWELMSYHTNCNGLAVIRRM
jgi:hypothetical protein